jgi:hypothetical protein
MPRADKVKLASAAISGIALACVQIRRLTEDQALAEIRVELAAIPADRRQEALDEAASLYVRPGPLDHFYPSAAALIERAGASLDSARRLRDSRGGPRNI